MRDWEPTPKAFQNLLSWLDPDREEAAKRYEAIRSRLITLFRCRGNACPEELADETIDRVTRKVAPDFVADYVGDPALFFYGVARHVHQEAVRRMPEPPVMQPAPPPDQAEKEDRCLRRCLERLPERDRQLILGYYQEQKRAKIDHRKELAEKFGLAVNALRIRVCRIRGQLRPCLSECLGLGGG